MWPDATGRWPWEEQATPRSRTRQAFAWLPVDQHPAGSWRLLGEFPDDFPLPAEPDSWALTSRSVLEGRHTPTLVLFDDDVFDVLDDRGHDADDLCTTYLGNLVRRHPTLRELSDINEGTLATAGPDGTWTQSTPSASQRTASVAAWEQGNAARVTD